MDVKKLTAALAEKMQAEQDKYRTWLLSQPPAEILNHTYEYTIRQDILIALEDHDLTAAQAETLLASYTPLADIYKDWCNQETGYMDNIRDTIEGRADDLIQREEEIRKSPVYKYPFDYAKENGELDQYRASHQANIACKQAIENEISNRHDGFSFDCKAAVHAVVKKFGYDRTLYVLAARCVTRNTMAGFRTKTRTGRGPSLSLRMRTELAKTETGSLWCRATPHLWTAL